jgi:hypothetical protein
LLGKLFDLPLFLNQRRAHLVKPRKEWLDKQPRRVGAAYVLGMESVFAAWDARGNGMAFEVTQEGFAEFGRQLMNAHEVLDPYFSGDKPPPVELYVHWFAVGKGASWPPSLMRTRINEYVERIDKWDPACDSVASMLMPRWHGELGDAHRFAVSVRDKVGGNAGKAAYARIAVSLFPFHERDVWVQNLRQANNQAPTLGFDLPETKAGLLYILENEPASLSFLKSVFDLAGAYHDDELARAVLHRKERDLKGEVIGGVR